MYVKNKEALAETRASADDPSGTIPLRKNSISKASVITKEKMVKKVGNKAEGTTGMIVNVVTGAQRSLE